MGRLFHFGRAVKTSMIWSHLNRDLKEVREPCGCLRERYFRKRKQSMCDFWNRSAQCLRTARSPVGWSRMNKKETSRRWGQKGSFMLDHLGPHKPWWYQTRFVLNVMEILWRLWAEVWQALSTRCGSAYSLDSCKLQLWPSLLFLLTLWREGS